MQVNARLTEIRVELSDGQQILVAQIEIDCACCGPIRYSVPGHHLKLLRDLLTQVIDRHTDLPDSTITQGESQSLVVPPKPPDPSRN